MGLMIDGVYLINDPEPDSSADGTFRRKESTIRNWITPDGSAGPTGIGGFLPEDGRYHLFAAWNCPWAHRALLTRAYLGLEDNISVSMAKLRIPNDCNHCFLSIVTTDS